MTRRMEIHYERLMDELFEFKKLVENNYKGKTKAWVLLQLKNAELSLENILINEKKKEEKN